jgi:hypothetical protein
MEGNSDCYNNSAFLALSLEIASRGWTFYVISSFCQILGPRSYETRFPTPSEGSCNELDLLREASIDKIEQKKYLALATATL